MCGKNRGRLKNKWSFVLSKWPHVMSKQIFFCRVIERSDCEKMLGVKIDYKLNFDEHMKTLCSKANNKLRALARATPYMSVEKKKILMNSFFQRTV